MAIPPPAEDVRSRLTSATTSFSPQQQRPRRPLPALALAYVLGIVAGVHYAVDPLRLLFAGGSCVLAVMVCRKSHWVGIFLHVAIFLVGWSTIELKSSEHVSTSILQHIQRSREQVDVTGRIVSQPQALIANARGSIAWRFDLAIESSRRGVRMEPATGRIRVTLTGNEHQDRVPAYGDRWGIKGVLSSDQRTLRRMQGLAGFVTAQMDYTRHLESDAGNPVVAFCYRMRAMAYDRLGWGLEHSAGDAALPRALLLGYRQDVPGAIYDAFARTGTLHILALSGMHVGILIMLLIVVLKACGITRPYWVYYFFPFLAVYTLGTGAAPSTVRASIMAVVFFGAFMFRRKPDTTSSLALAALLILIVDPLQLFEYGFILSFVVVWGLITLYPALRSWFKDKTDTDPWADPEISWFASSHPLWRKAVDMSGISVAAWLASLPLIANVFNLISPVALLVNLALVPLAFVVLLTACLSLFTGIFWIGGASIFNHANWFFSKVLVSLVEWSSDIPGSHVYVPAWSWLWVTIWYTAIVVWLIGRKWHRRLAVAGMGLLLAASITERVWSRDATAAVIPVGDVNVLLLDGPGEHAVLVDTGSMFHQRVLLEQLRKRGISRINQVWISRATSDAYGGLTALLDAMKVEQVFLPDVPPSQRRFQTLADGWRRQIDARQLHVWSRGTDHEGPGELVWKVMYPEGTGTYQNARRSAMMLHVSRHHHSLLFMSQSDDRLEMSAATLPLDFDADTLIVGRCNNLNGLSDAWLSVVDPKVIVLSTRGFERLPFGGSSFMRRLNRHGDVEIKTTDLRDGISLSL